MHNCTGSDSDEEDNGAESGDEGDTEASSLVSEEDEERYLQLLQLSQSVWFHSVSLFHPPRLLFQFLESVDVDLLASAYLLQSLKHTFLWCIF